MHASPTDISTCGGALATAFPIYAIPTARWSTRAMVSATSPPTLMPPRDTTNSAVCCSLSGPLVGAGETPGTRRMHKQETTSATSQTLLAHGAWLSPQLMLRGPEAMRHRRPPTSLDTRCWQRRFARVAAMCRRSYTRAFVRHGQWTPTRAIADAEQLADPLQRADALATLVPLISGSARERVLGETLDAAQEIRDVAGRAEVLAALAENLSSGERERVLGDALDAVQEIRDESRRARTLTLSPEHLPR